MTHTAREAHPPVRERDGRTLRADARRNRDRVLAAARARFAHDGLEAQVDEIATDAGVGVGTVYRHFPAKEDLLEALAEVHFEDLARAARTALDDPDAGRAFRSFVRHAAAVAATDRALSEALGQLPGLCARASERVGLRELTADLVARAHAAGELREGIVGADIGALMCGLGGVVQPAAGKPTMSWERYVEILLAGLTASDAPPLPGPPSAIDPPARNTPTGI